jgi:hypothetical protein
LVAGVSQSQASVIQIFSRSQAGSDFLDWGNLGPPFPNPTPTQTTVPNGSTITSQNGFTWTVSQPSGDFQTAQEDGGVSWNGIFNSGDHLLWNQANGLTVETMTLDFGSRGTNAVGAQIQALASGDFQAEMQVFDGMGNLLGTFLSPIVTNDSSEQNTAPFLGALSTNFDIHRVVYSLVSAGGGEGNPDSFAINQFNFADPSLVPEPSTLAVFGACLLGVLISFWGKGKRVASLATP